MSIFGPPAVDTSDTIQAQLKEAWPSEFGTFSLDGLLKYNRVKIDLEEVTPFLHDVLDTLEEAASVEEFEASMEKSKNMKQEKVRESLKASGRKVSIKPEVGLPLSSRTGRAVYRAAKSGSLSCLTDVVRCTADQWQTVKAEVFETDIAVTQSNRDHGDSSPEPPFTQADPSRAFASSIDSSDSSGDESDNSASDDVSIRQIEELSTELPPDAKQVEIGDGIRGDILDDGTAGSHDFPTIHDKAVSGPGQEASCSIDEQTVSPQAGGLDVESQNRGAEKKNSPRATCYTSQVTPGSSQSNSAVQATPTPDHAPSQNAKPGRRRRSLSDTHDSDSHAAKKARM